MSAGDDNCASTGGGAVISQRVADTDVSMSCIPSSSHHVSGHGGGGAVISQRVADTDVPMSCIPSSSHHVRGHVDGGGAVISQRVADTNVSMSCIPSSHHVSGHGGGGFDEITEIIEEAQASNNGHNHLDHHNLVYVAVGNGDTSMDALMWTLTHALLPPTTLVYLVHIFSDPKFFPSPLGGGRVPKSQVSPQLAETYMAQDRSKRRELLNNYIHKCTAHMVQVETILIESDSVTDAITELISVVNIPKLFIGISNSNLRKVREGKGKGSGIVGEEIMQRAPAGCEVNIICQGNNVTHQLSSIPESMSPVAKQLHSTPPKEGSKDTRMHQHSSPSRSFSCCFKPKA